MRTFEVKNVEEAVELAVKFKRDGNYNWFRGQTRDWRPVCSIGRLTDDSNAIEVVKKRQARFYHWMAKTPGLERLAKNHDVVFAIAQHYGIPTCFLDFTTNPSVAGFFAANDDDRDLGSNGCIYCLDTADFGDFWKIMRNHLKNFQSAPNIEFIKPNVPNLWRLEAQHGVFLYAPVNFDKVYPLDRIIFPQSGRPSYPTSDDVYPKRKSQLELLLDRFFSADASSDWLKVAKTIHPNVKVFQIKTPPNRCEPKCFVAGALPEVSSWNSSRLKRWKCVVKELLHETPLVEIGLQIKLKAEPVVLRERVVFGIRRALQIHPNLRKKAVRWMIAPQKNLPKKLSQTLDWLWNGMRTLPYSDEDLAEAIGLCFALYRLGYADAETDEQALRITRECLGDPVGVEFCSWEGCVNRGFVSARELRGAVRPDIEKHLVISYTKYSPYVQSLMQMCSAPNRLFSFHRFARLFGRQIIPTQILRPKRDACLFSPARLEGFGLP